MNSDLLRGFYLRELLVDPIKGHVIGKSGTVHLQPKAMEALLVLASYPSTLVTREKLIDEVWGAGHGSQEALNHVVSDIRHALDDQADDPKYIQTLPKRGYRLLAEVVPATAHTASIIIGRKNATSNIGLFENLKQRGVLETAIAYLLLGWLLIQIADIVFSQLLLPDWIGTFVTVLVIAGFPIAVILSWFLEFRDGRAVLHELSANALLRRRFSRTYVSVVGALAIAALIVFVYDQSIGLPQAETTKTQAIPGQVELPPIQDNSIAVLPFLNLDGSDETQIFSNGLADDVITRLTRVPGLLVSSRGDSFTLDPNTGSSRVRERLRVALYLEGSVEIIDNQMRVIVQMIDSATGFHVLSKRFDRPLEGFFKMRDEITELTVANIRVTLPADTQAATIATGDDPNLDAYILYRRGVDESYGPKTIATIETALSWYDAALEVDPDYAAAHAGKCTIFVDAYREIDDSAYIDMAKTACANALDLNPNLDVVHAALGDLYGATGLYAQAETAYLSALETNPNLVPALTGLGTTYLRLGNPDEAEARFRQAIGQNPGDWSAYNSLGGFLYRSGRYTEAAAEFERAVALDNTNMLGYSNLGTAHMLDGNFTAAASALQKAIDIEPWPNTYSNLGLIHYYLGDFDEAILSHQQAIELAPRDHLKWSNLGDALSIAGQVAEAKVVFETAEDLANDALEVNPNDLYVQIDLAWISAMLGKYENARDFIDRAHAAELDDPYIHFIDGLILLASGNTDAALSALDNAANAGYSLQMMAAEPHLAGIRGHPRFSEILDRH